MRSIILLAAGIFCQSILAQSTSSTTSKKHGFDKADAMQSWNFGGAEFIAPRNLKHGYSVKNQFLSGPTVDLFGGIVKLSVLSGFYSNSDSLPGKELTVKSNRFSMSINYPFIIIPSKKFNLVPHIGLGIFSQSGAHPFMKSTGDGNVFGFQANPGISLIVGPIKASACYYFEGGYAEKSTINRGLHGFPSFSIAFSPQVFLFNPQVFSHTGIKRWRENYSSYTVLSDKVYLPDGSVQAKATTYTSWDEMSAVKTAEIKDVRPFFFVGPRLQTSFRRINQNAIIPTYGVNMGFRSGTFYVNGFYDKGSFYFREPFKRDETRAENPTEAKVQRLDGYLTGGNRIGAEIGLDLVTYFIKKGYDEQSAFYNKTSYYGIILKFGYSQQTFTNTQFFADSGSTYLSNWMTTNIVPGNQQGYKFRGDIRTAPRKSNSYNIGIVGSVGAFAINYDYFIHKKLNVMSHSEVSICYHYPISRFVKAIGVYRKTHRKN